MNTLNILVKRLVAIISFSCCLLLSALVIASPLRTHVTKNLSPYIKKNQYEALLKELRLRHDCRFYADLHSCGMDSDDVIKMTNEHHMNLLYQLVVSNTIVDKMMIEKHEEVLALLLEEGFDPFQKLNKKGGNAFTLSLQYQHPHMFKVLINYAMKSEQAECMLHDINLDGDDLSHLAAKYLPLNNEIVNLLESVGFDDNNVNKKSWSAKQLRTAYSKRQNDEL